MLMLADLAVLLGVMMAMRTVCLRCRASGDGAKGIALRTQQKYGN